MKSFLDYVKFRETSIADPDAINPSENNNDEILEDIIKIAWKSNESEVRAFFKRLAQTNPEIEKHLKKLKKDTADFMKKSNKDIDMVRPPLADTGGDLNNSNL